MFCILFLSFMIILFNNIFLLLATFAPLTSWEHSYGTFSFVFFLHPHFLFPYVNWNNKTFSLDLWVVWLDSASTEMCYCCFDTLFILFYIFFSFLACLLTSSRTELVEEAMECVFKELSHFYCALCLFTYLRVNLQLFCSLLETLW